MAKENRAGAMIALWGLEESPGHQLSHQTVGNILRRHGLSPAPNFSRICRSSVFISLFIHDSHPVGALFAVKEQALSESAHVGLLPWYRT
jgi:hypothetical protein